MCGFVYIWRDRKHKRYYVGSHWGTPDDGYICSSPWMKRAYKQRPQDFRRRILVTISTSKRDLLDEEYRYLALIKDDELTKRYYNVHNHPNNQWWCDPEKSKIIGEKISSSQKGKPKKGGKMSEQGRKNVSAAMKLYFSVPENRERLSTQNIGKEPWNKGKTGLQKSWNKGKTTSEETKRKISMSKLGKKHAKKRVYKVKEL